MCASVPAAILVGLVGPSGTGKTTLLERLIPVLQERGLSVAAVKHASHGFEADRPGKDSHRLYQSGADAVALVSRDQVAVFARGSGGPHPPRLSDALATLPGRFDVVLVEGFSWEPIPRLVLVRGDQSPPPEHRAGGEVLGVVRVPDSAPGEKPPFPEVRIAELATLVETLAQPSARTAWRAPRGSGAERPT